jgi:hypothetical protein
MTWENCNDDFRECNHRACETSYPLATKLSQSPSPPPPPPPLPNTTTPVPDSWWNSTAGISWLNWGCHILADTYADAVNTRFGAWAFWLSNEDRCECRCPASTFDCGAYCMMECEAINEDAVVEVHKGRPGFYAAGG